MNTCIYCPPTKASPADGKEHWVPRWLGTYRGADTLLDRLCQACNKRLGDTLDLPMSRTGPEALDRYRRQIKGRSGRVANPFRYKAQGANPPTIAIGSFPGFETPLLLEDQPGAGEPSPRVLPQILVRDGADKVEPVPLPDGLDDERAGPWLKAALERRGLGTGKLHALICDKAETVIGEVEQGGEVPIWIRKALLFVFGDPGGFQHFTPDGGDASLTKVDIKLEISVEYARAVAKLAFHYALKQVPALDGHDPAFAPIKKFILDGDGHPDAFLNFSAPTFLLSVVGERPTDGHFLMLDVRRDVVRAFVKTFVHSPYSREAISVDLGPTPSTVFRFPVTGHHLRLFPDGQKEGHDGEFLGLKTLWFRDRWAVVVAP